jgi:hypothetical protein
MRTVTIDAFSDEAMSILKSLDALKIIRIYNDTERSNYSPVDFIAKYKEGMTKQSPEEIDKQLNELRNEWD